jgi:hypothetical protein
MRDATIDDTATAVFALINSVPRTPSASEIASVIERAAAAESVPSRLTLELRQRRQALHSAIAEALASEESTVYEAASAEVRRHYQELGDLANEVWQRSVGSWDDIVMRVEVALAYHLNAVEDSIEGLDATCPFERSLAELLKAIAVLSGTQLPTAARHG